MKKNSSTTQLIDLDIAGSSTFGRNPKIMASRSFNMILSDGWYVGYAGNKKIINTNSSGEGRGIFTSIRGEFLLTVIGNIVYRVQIVGSTLQNQKLYSLAPVGKIDSFSGDVFIDENNTNQIAICDQHKLYIYNYIDEYFVQATLPVGFNPGYVTYQNGRFICPDTKSSQWILSQVGDGLNWFWNNSGGPVLGSIQTKPDLAQVTVRVPGRGNLLFVMGKTVTELWTDIGGALFPYQRSYSVNIDYGCINPATIASLDHLVAWVGINEKAGPVLMYSSGSDIQQISTDGINYRLTQLQYPSQCSAFFVKLGGHSIYQVTFYNPADNYSFIYDFTTQKFFDVTDENMDFHIARHVAFFQGDYYFISFKDNDIYKMAMELTNYDYGVFENGSPNIREIPRIRICSNIRYPNQGRFTLNNITFTLEQGDDYSNSGNDPNYLPRIGLSLSKNGGINFSNYVTKDIYKAGVRPNKLNWWGLGQANDFVPQFRFWGKGPWKATNGIASLIQ